MMLAKCRLLAALAAAVTLASTAGAQSPNVLDFDDLLGTADVPDGYGGVPEWGSWESTDVADPDFPLDQTYIRSTGTQERISFGGGSIFFGAQVITEAPFQWKGYRLGQLVISSPVVQPNLGGAPTPSGFDSLAVIDELEIETTGAHGVDGFTWLPALSAGIGLDYCTASANSTGGPASIAALGSPSVAANDITLLATNVPPGQFGIFITSRAQASFPFGNGFLCIGGPTAPIGRFVGPGEVQAADAAGELSLAIDLSSMPVGILPAAVLPGESWNFQAWYRDPVDAGFNTTGGTEVTFFL